MQFMELSCLHMVWYPVIELYLECTIVARWQREHPDCTVILTCKNVRPARYQARCMKIGEIVPYCYWNYQWRGHNKEYPRVSIVGLNLQVSMKSPLFNFLGAFFKFRCLAKNQNEPPQRLWPIATFFFFFCQSLNLFFISIELRTIATETEHMDEK
jgi:hypothetical protein